MFHQVGILSRQLLLLSLQVSAARAKDWIQLEERTTRRRWATDMLDVPSFSLSQDDRGLDRVRLERRSLLPSEPFSNRNHCTTLLLSPLSGCWEGLW